MTIESLATVTLVVPNYDDGKAFYVDQLGFDLIEDTELGDGKRWLVVGHTSGANLLLAEAASDSQRAAIGNQTGRRVAFFLETDDFVATHARFIAAGVTFHEEPRHEPYGTVAVFSDPFGNRWDLLQRKENA